MEALGFPAPHTLLQPQRQLPGRAEIKCRWMEASARGPTHNLTGLHVHAKRCPSPATGIEVQQMLAVTKEHSDAHPQACRHVLGTQYLGVHIPTHTGTMMECWGQGGTLHVQSPYIKR